MLAAEEPEHAASLVAACDNGAEVGDHEGSRRSTALGVVGVGDREEQHHEDAEGEVAARGVEHGEDRKVLGPPEHVAVDLLPAALVAAAVHALELLGVGGGVPREVALEGLHEDDRHDRAEEEAEHEGVDDGEPVHLVLEELRVEISRGPVLEGLLRGVPDGGVGEVERGALVHRPGIRGLHVDFDDLVLVPEEREMAVREDAREGLALEVLRHRRRALGVVRRRVAGPCQPREAAHVQAELGVLTHEGPDGQVVDVELVPIVVVDHRGEPLGLLRRQNHTADAPLRGLLAEVNSEARRGEELVAL
mmetsp:Transcript_71625/g.221507  ORF Transcript_71625/g.221507 Transcript_71625/m.221507 type:complete len:306 (+) Transcript_71625:917-1834(+)